MKSENVDISVIVPVLGSRYDKTGGLIESYLTAIESMGRPFELVCVLDGDKSELSSSLNQLQEKTEHLRIIQLSKSFGESTALAAGIEAAGGELLLTLPAFPQVETEELSKLFAEIDDNDMVVAVRHPRRVTSKFDGFRRQTFHKLVRWLAKEEFRDLGCGVRLLKRRVIEEIQLYGDQDRYLTLLAARRGFRVREVEVAQSSEDRFSGHYKPSMYARRLLDIFTVFFLTRFTKKPLRFFGMIGSVTTLVGGVFLAFIIAERLIFGTALSDRPALLLSSLLVVLGLQLFALGLLGELIIFTHARKIKEYTIDKIVN